MRRHSSLLPSAVRRIFELPTSRARVARELSDEMQIHLDMRVEDLRALGMTESDARAEAVRRFGDEEEFQAYTARRAAVRARGSGIRELSAEWRQDLRFALRLSRKHARLTLLVVFTLALGIGANTAIFSVVHRLLIAPLPYPDGDRIVMLAMEGKNRGFARPGDDALHAWRARAHSLAMIGAVSIDYIMVQEPGERDSIVAAVTSNYLRLLGIAPALGRDFTPEDERPGSPRVAMISYGLWQRVYGGRPDVLGKSIVATDRTDNPALGTPRNAVAHVIIGVAPPNMGLPISYEPPGSKWRQATPSIWVPASLDSLGEADTYAKLRSGVSAAQASQGASEHPRQRPAARGRPTIGGRCTQVLRASRPRAGHARSARDADDRDSLRRRRGAAADCLRERCQFAHGARVDAPARVRGAHRARRRARTTHAPRADRERSARARGRPARHRARVGDAACRRRHAAAGSRESRRRARRADGAALVRWCVGAYRSPVRLRAGTAVDRWIGRRRAQERVTRELGRPTRAPSFGRR